MSIFDENNYIEISSEDIKDASYSSAKIDDNIQNRAFANVLGARLGIKFLKSLNINASNFESLYIIPAVLKDMDISDICVDNNIKVDIRIVADEDHLCVPKAQFEYNVTPDIYIFIKLSEDFSTTSFIGAIAPDEINKSIENRDYYFINKEILYNENSLKEALKKGKPQSHISVSENDVIKAESMLVNFIDGDILNNEKHFVYEILKQSQELRTMFAEFERFETISTVLAHTEEILSDSVLDVLGAQQIYNNDLSDGEFASDINLDELADSTVADFVEDFIDDNKEENMLEDENIIEGEFEELSEDEQVEEPGQLEELPTDEDLANFATTNNLEHIEENEFEVLNLDETEENNVDLTDNGFEGFVGLDSNVDSETPLEDLTSELNTPELSLNDIGENSVDFSANTEDNFMSELSQLDEIQPLEELSPIENLDEIEPIEETSSEIQDLEDTEVENDVEIIDFSTTEDLTEDNTEIDNSFDFDEVNEIDSPTSLMDAVQNEGMEVNVEENFESLNATEQPIDLTLPELNTNFGFEEDDDEPEENNEDPTSQNSIKFAEETLNEQTTLDDIAQDINFENIDVDGLEVPELEDLTPSEDLELQSEDIDLSDFEINADITPVQEETPIAEEISAQEKNNEEEDFSGLEEFTMDMASEVERANPNLLNPQGPVENSNQGFNQFDNFNPANGFTPAPEFAEENFNNTSSENESTFDGFGDFSGFNENNNQEQNNDSQVSIDDINLDDLDDFDETEEYSQPTNQTPEFTNNQDINSELDNLINDSDLDLSEINLDDIDLNDPDIQNIDIDMDDFDMDNISSLDSIPDVSNENQYQQNDDYQNQYMQEQMGIPANNQEEYTPDFNANDQNTIETLYEDSPQNSIPGEAMNQSFNNNQVNYTQQQKPVKKKTSPLLGILLIVLVCALGYMKKDMIIEKINTTKGVTVSQDQNMPIEGETQEDKQDAELLNESNEETAPEDINEVKQGIGEIPGEAGGPQDVESMNASLNQKGSMVQKMPQSFSKTPEPLATSTVKRLYWEIPQELTYNDSVVHFLKTAGKTIKFSMQSDLLNATETPYSTKMIVDIIIKKDGTIDKVNCSVSSGSKQIDSIVLQSVKAALKYVKAPTTEFKNDSYDFSLIINF